MSTILAKEHPMSGLSAALLVVNRPWVRSLGYNILGIVLLLGAWWIGGWLIASSDDLFAFADFAPAPALARLAEMIGSGEAVQMILPSLQRVGLGLFWAILIGVPMGILVGWFAAVRAVTNLPFQFLRMISPLSWMPKTGAFATERQASMPGSE